jgi:YidC/Oxa1 family membrane protein insertase
MHFLWSNLFYIPLYNSLVFLVSVLPWHDVGLAVIILTLIVKFILLPLSKQSIVSQIKLKKLEPEINKIKENFPKKEDQAQKTMALYKDNKINPFSGFFLILIQIPIIFALYFVFLKGLSFSDNILYPFVKLSSNINWNFLHLVDLHKKSLFLAVLAGVTQYFQTKISTQPFVPDNKDKSFKNELMKSMNLQMKYVLPVFIGFIAYQISSAVALYWVTSNVFMIGQELFVIKKIRKEM